MGRSKLKKLKKLNDMVTEYHTELLAEIEKIKKEHSKVLLESNSNLISDICKGEGLDELDIKEKYLKKSKKKQVKEDEVETNSEDTNILNHIKLEGTDYFYEDKDNGSVFNTSNKKVGIYAKGVIKLS